MGEMSILYSLRESEISILWNGGRLPAFKPGRGLRQGDPLAPYLFNLVMERLAYEIQSKVNAGHWKPIRISRGGIGISHLFFADDLMLFGDGTERQANVMMYCLNNFSNSSGLNINLSKSLIFCSPNLNAGTKRSIAERMNIPISDNLGSYLGIPMLQKRVSKHTFTTVLDKMRRKLATWKANSLSMAGRRVLGWPQFQHIPCRPWLYRLIPVMTLTEFAGTFCEVFSDQNKLWVKVIRDKYVKDKDFLQVQAINTSSWGWRSILKGRNILAEGVRWRLGKGDSGSEGEQEDLDWVWRTNCTEKIKIFLWKILKNGLMTNVERQRRGLSATATCPCCGVYDETMDHLFRQCDVAAECWSSATGQNDGNPPGTLDEAARNNISFNGTWTPPSEILRRATEGAKEAERLLNHKGPGTARQHWVAWSPPPPGVIKINTDGASTGGLIRDHTGQWIVGFISNVGVTNSFIAELWGFREGLMVAKAPGFDKIKAETDSESLKQALESRSDSSLTASTLIADCLHLMGHFTYIEVTHVLREDNQCADFLANLGQEASWGTTLLENPPDSVRELLVRDSHSVATSRRR
ncbi:uncharacterized protein LOC116023644 [Ipomoea triloba]|uniref:uncharacterized protein LOC116023644 n=1 Tax=Ipomoea triloba TaxID=35885 RepID=UPI00125D6C31|nr:uncharacterized protein LOC116023644 [Ipomoea triloba]